MPPKTHSLIALSKKVNIPEDLLSLLRRLNADYLTSRYPDVDGVTPKEAYDKVMIEERITYAEDVMEWIKENLS